MNAIELIIQGSIVFLFLIFIWAKFTKQEVGDVLRKIKSIFYGGEDNLPDDNDPNFGGILR